MPLTDEERTAIIVYRLEKADDALVEARDCASCGHWTQEDVEPYFQKVEAFIEKIKFIIYA